MLTVSLDQFDSFLAIKSVDDIMFLDTVKMSVNKKVRK